MPKMKTNRGAAKRFKRTGTGRIKARRACRGHMLTKRSQRSKRQLRRTGTIDKTHQAEVRRLLNI